MSSDGIAATGAFGESVALSGGGVQINGADSAIQISASNEVEINAGDAVRMNAPAVDIFCDLMSLNSRPVATELMTATDSEMTSASFDVLSGGTSYIYTQPLTSLSVASVASSMQEAWLEFTVASGGSVSINDSGFKWLNSRPSAFEGGSSYAVGFRWGRQAVAVPLEG